MFESVVPRVYRRPSHRALYEALPFSIILHATAAAAIMASPTWNVEFPLTVPRIVVPYSLTRVPDPPPPPPPAPTATTTPAPKVENAPPPPPPAPTMIVAPTIIPDLIPKVAEVAAPDPPPEIPAPVATTAAPAAAPGGVAGGQEGGTIGGTLGGKKFGTAGGITFGDDGRVHVDRRSKLPLKVIEQEFPRYPDSARKLRLEDTVVVRYVVGLTGRVEDVAILQHANNPLFDDETVNVIRRWRFRPLSIDGKRYEVEHEVEMIYQFTAR